MLQSQQRCAGSADIDGAEPQDSTLFGPRGGDWLESLQTPGSERDRLTAVEDRFDNVGGEKCQREDPAHLAIVYAGMNRNFGADFAAPVESCLSQT